MHANFSVISRPTINAIMMTDTALDESNQFKSAFLEDPCDIRSFVPLHQNLWITDEPFASKFISNDYKQNIEENDDIIEENPFISLSNDGNYFNSEKNLLFDISSFTEQYNNAQIFHPNEFSILFPENSDNEAKEELHLIESFKNQKDEDQISIQTSERSIELYSSDFYWKPYISTSHGLSHSIISEIEPFNEVSEVDSCTFIDNEQNEFYEDFTSFNGGSLSNCLSNSIFDSTFQSMKVPILQFDIPPTICYEPFTNEWLRDLQISENEFETLIEKKSILQQSLELPKRKNQQRTFPTIGKIQELYLPIKLDSTRQLEEFLIQHQHPTNFEKNNLKDFPVEKIPPIIQINTSFFEKNDIEQFSKLFPSLKIIPVSLEHPILFTINQTLVNLLFYNGDYEEIFEKSVELLKVFDFVLITTTIQPKIIMSDRIKWRCIISHSQISTVIIPFLMNEKLLT